MNQPAPPTTPRTIVVLALATIAWRIALAFRTPVPSGDGTSYLWIAQQFAEGRWGLGLSEVFPPGFSLLLAPWLALGCEPWASGVVTCVAAAGLTVWPLVRIADRVRPGAGVVAGVLWASSSLLARNAVEVFSEAPYLLAMAIGSLHGLRARWWRCGLWSGIAFWIRPEGALLAASFALTEPRQAVRTCLPVGLAVLGLGWLRWSHGHGFDPLPMLLFHVNERDDLPERGDAFANVLHVPAAWAEAFGPAGFLPLLLAFRRWRPGRHAVPFGWQIVLQIGAMLTFVTRRRFLLSAAVAAVAAGGAALAGLPRGWRRMLLAVCVVFGVAAAWRGVTDPDRIAERALGERFAVVLSAEDDFVTDLTRIRWFAGRRPLWPRHRSAAELIAAAAPPNVRWVALRERSPECAEVERALLPTFVRAELPPELAELVRERGIAVLSRR